MGDRLPQIEWVKLSFLKHIENFSIKRVNWLTAKIQKEQCWTKPLCIDRTHYLVMDGQHRMEAAKKLGLNYIPCLLFNYESIEIWSLRENYLVDHNTVISRALEGNIYPYKTVKHRFPFELPITSYPLNDLLNMPQELSKETVLCV